MKYKELKLIEKKIGLKEKEYSEINDAQRNMSRWEVPGWIHQMVYNKLTNKATELFNEIETLKNSEL